MSAHTLVSQPTTTRTAARDDRAAVDKAMALLAGFAGAGDRGIGVSELARRTCLSKSTAFRILGMLERNGAVERFGSGYRLGSQMYDLGYSVYPAHFFQLRDFLTPYLADLYQASGKTVHLAVLHGSDVLYLNKLYGHRQPPSPSRIGGRVPSHATAVGKALLASTASPLEEILGPTLRRRTPFTIGDLPSLDRHLDSVRATGLAYDNQESGIGLSCVGAPVFGTDGRPIAAMSVSDLSGNFEPAQHSRLLRQICSSATRDFPSARISQDG